MVTHEKLQSLKFADPGLSDNASALGNQTIVASVFSLLFCLRASLGLEKSDPAVAFLLLQIRRGRIRDGVSVTLLLYVMDCLWRWKTNACYFGHVSSVTDFTSG